MKKNDEMAILIQHFYGNRTVTFIDPDNLDATMLGYIDAELFDKTRDQEKIDRTIIRIPDTENLVLVYNKYQEEEHLKELQHFIQEVYKRKDRFNPSAVIPETANVLYSRCIACRINEDGALVSLEEEDCPKVVKYLTA